VAEGIILLVDMAAHAPFQRFIPSEPLSRSDGRGMLKSKRIAAAKLEALAASLKLASFFSQAFSDQAAISLRKGLKAKELS